MQHLHDGVDRRRALERRPSREHLVQDGAEGVNVGRHTDAMRLTGRLLRRHVAGRADDLAAERAAAVPIEPFGQTEIGDLREEIRQPKSEIGRQREVGSAKTNGMGLREWGLWFCFGLRTSALRFSLQQDIRRLEVAMDNAVLMGEVHGPGQRFDELDGRFDGLRVAVQMLAEAAVRGVFQHEIGDAVRLADIVDLHDIAR